MPDLELRIKTPAELDGLKDAEKAVKDVTTATGAHTQASKENITTQKEVAAAQLAGNQAARAGAAENDGLTVSKRNLLGALKALKNEVPGLGLLITALKNPFVGLVAIFSTVIGGLVSMIARVRESARAFEDYMVGVILARHAADDWEKSLTSNIKSLRELQAQEEIYAKSKEAKTPGAREAAQSKIKGIDDAAAAEKAALAGLPDSPEKRARLHAIDQKALQDKAAVMEAAAGQAAQDETNADAAFNRAGSDASELSPKAARARKIFEDAKKENETLFTAEDAELNKARRAKDRGRPGGMMARNAEKKIAGIEARRADRKAALDGWEGNALSLEGQLAEAEAARKAAMDSGSGAAQFGREAAASADEYRGSARTGASIFLQTESQAIRNERAAATTQAAAGARQIIGSFNPSTDAENNGALAEAIKTVRANSQGALRAIIDELLADNRITLDELKRLKVALKNRNTYD
jgi:hypothetical protein